MKLVESLQFLATVSPVIGPKILVRPMAEKALKAMTDAGKIGLSTRISSGFKWMSLSFYFGSKISRSIPFRRKKFGNRLFISHKLYYVIRVYFYLVHGHYLCFYRADVKTIFWRPHSISCDAVDLHAEK